MIITQTSEIHSRIGMKVKKDDILDGEIFIIPNADPFSLRKRVGNEFHTSYDKGLTFKYTHYWTDLYDFGDFVIKG